MISDHGAQITSNLTGGYSKVPDFIFDLGLKPNQILVLFNLIRRANKYGVCFPSLNRICMDTGIKSQNTVRKAIQSLLERELIEIISKPKGQCTTYKVAPFFYESIKLADENYKKKKEKTTHSLIEGVTPSIDEHIPLQHMSTKENKKENKIFKEKSENEVFTKEVLENSFNSCNIKDTTTTCEPKEKNISSAIDKEKKNCSNSNEGNLNGGVKHIGEKELIKKLGIKNKPMLKDPTYGSDLGYRKKVQADAYLKSLKEINLRDRPEIYKLTIYKNKKKKRFLDFREGGLNL